MSSWLLLFGLGVAWAVVLVPDFVRRNAASRRSDTIGQFARNLASLERSAPVGSPRSNVVPFPARPASYQAPVIDLRDSTGRPTVTPGRPVSAPGRSVAARRRQDILSALVAAAIISFLGSISMGGTFVMINAVILVALGLYVAAAALAARREKLRAQVGVLYTGQFSGVVPAMAQRQRIAR